MKPRSIKSYIITVIITAAISVAGTVTYFLLKDQTT